MAEIHVQTKKHNASNTMWIWIVLALVIVGAVIYYLTTRNKNANNTTPPNAAAVPVNFSTNPLSIENILREQDAVMSLC